MIGKRILREAFHLNCVTAFTRQLRHHVAKFAHSIPVVSSPPDHLVGILSATQIIVARASIQHVIALTADEVVIPTFPTQDIRALEPVNIVVAGPADNGVRILCAE